jgi:5'-nucleotidase
VASFDGAAMKILLTNDDGVDAPGLALLREVVLERAEAVIVAPDRHLSGCGHRVSTEEELVLEERGPDRFALSGTPADCVRVGLLHVCPDADWVLSGVNDGGNLGVDTYLSGTVAGAREGALFNRPSVALSRYRKGQDGKDWASLTDHLRRVLRMLLDEPPGPGAVWNVNFPAAQDVTEKSRAVRCPLEPGHLPVRYAAAGNRFRYQGVYADRPRRPGSDVDVCFSGNIAITRLRLF